jgi:hypothetical protein
MIALVGEGKLSESDLKRMHVLLQQRLQETSKLGPRPQSHEVRSRRIVAFGSVNLAY